MGMGMAWQCESDMAALCKSNGKDTFYTLSGMAWQGNGMGVAWARHAMCESVFTGHGNDRPHTSAITNVEALHLVPPWITPFIKIR